MAFSRDSIRQAMKRQDRTLFLPGPSKQDAGRDRPVPIGRGQTNSQPTTVADMLELLEVERVQRVLDVGSGSGWTAALLADLVGEQGQVTGTELIPELAQSARVALSGLCMPWASIHDAEPNHLGYPANAPYDRMLVSAQATRVPRSLLDQLSNGGIMVIPVAGTMLRIIKQDRENQITRHGQYAFVPLIGD